MISNLIKSLGKLFPNPTAKIFKKNQSRLFSSQANLPKNYNFRPPTQYKIRKDPEVEYWHNQRETYSLYFYWTWGRARFALLSGVIVPVAFFYFGSLHQQNQAADFTGNDPQELFGFPSRHLDRAGQEVPKELFASNNSGPDAGSRIFTYYKQQFWPKAKRESKTEIL